MIIWSIQPQEVLDIVESGKVFRCDGRKSYYAKFDLFRTPYKWMSQQMKNRNIQNDNRYPVWGWYKFYSSYNNRKAPLLRQIKYCNNQFRLKLNIPDDLVLLSDYYSWDNVLSNIFCGSDRYVMKMMTLEDNKTWQKEKINRLKEKSWNKVFDINNSQGIQACFPMIRPEWLIKADKII